MWLCHAHPRCDSYVACHPGTTNPMGTLAGPRLRKLRGLAHDAFDPLWHQGGAIIDRDMAYRIAGQVMAIPDLHIGWLDEEGCLRLIDRVPMIERALEDYAQKVLVSLGRQGAVDAHDTGVAAFSEPLDETVAAFLRVVFQADEGAPPLETVTVRRLLSVALPVEELRLMGLLAVQRFDAPAEPLASLTVRGFTALGLKPLPNSVPWAH